MVWDEDEGSNKTLEELKDVGQVMDDTWRVYVPIRL